MISILDQHPYGDVFYGTVLNKPFHLKTVGEHQQIRFMAPDGFAHPILVTEKYMAERAQWQMSICGHCGLSELFDAPSDLQKKAFPNLPSDVNATSITFSTFCPACAGVRLVKQREDTDNAYTFKVNIESEPRQPFAVPFAIKTEAPRKWWQFWR